MQLSITYLLSEYTVTLSDKSYKCTTSNPLITPTNSIRLLVVLGSPPDIVETIFWSSSVITTPHPPTPPGLVLQEPSVYIFILEFGIVLYIFLH